MKKLRMIVTSVIVLAIVGSAFAFKAKAGAFCVRSVNDPGIDCTTYIQNVRIDPFGAAQYKHWPDWNGNKVACTASGNGKCPVYILTVSAD
jgi:hypothetical protein